MAQKPFWESAYSDPSGADPFGSAAKELIDLLPHLSQGSAVLDLGCGEGRNALCCARAGMRVTAVDISAAAISKLSSKADSAGLALQAHQSDVADFPLSDTYELVIAHGVLHLIEPPARDQILQAMQNSTSQGGWNIAAVFTDEIPPPDDLRDVCIGLFKEGQIFSAYTGWHVSMERSYILEDEHPGGIQHRHPVNKVVARKPGP